MPGPTSKTSRALADVRLQLKAGKTRKGRPLGDAEREALERKRDRLVAEMRAAREARLLNSINGHTTKEANRVVSEVGDSFEAALDRRFPQPTEELEGLREQKRRIDTAIRKKKEEAKQKKEEEKQQRVEAKTRSMDAKRQGKAKQQTETIYPGA